MKALFAGAAYDPDEDDERLTGQILRVFDVMKDGRWRTLAEIASVTGDPPASISAQLRHLRKPKFGAYVVCKRPRGVRSAGLFEYCVLPPGSAAIGAAPKPVKTRRSGFVNGLMYAAKILLKEPDLLAAQKALRRELIKAAKR